MIDEEGKAGRKVGEKWSAILVPSPAASNTPSVLRRIKVGVPVYCSSASTARAWSLHDRRRNKGLPNVDGRWSVFAG